MVVKNLFRAKMAIVVVVLLVVLVLPSSAYAQSQIHYVQRGDTLYSIARWYGTSVTAIMNANGLRNPNFIWVGQRLVIPGGGGSSGGGGGSSGSGGGSVHIVRWGETMYSIARRYGTSVQAVLNANGLSNPNYIYAGQRLIIPGGGGGGGSAPSTGGGGGSAPSGGSVHVVQRGQTLYSIARWYGTSVSAIMNANGLSNPNFIWVGQRLTIPGGGGGGGSTPSSGGGGGGGGAKWIDVDLSSQTTRAYQGNTLVRSMVVSTGVSYYPTPPGRFTIYAKYPSYTMSGPGYYLPGVPHTMFFYKGYALHGTYWHSNFGTPMSHGCINLTQGDAAWLYSWAPVGTSVVIHW
jgi:LysM repeat protein